MKQQITKTNSASKHLYAVTDSVIALRIHSVISDQ